MTRKRWIIVGVVVLALIAGAAWLFDSNEANARTPYRVAEIERGDIEETVASTGTVTAVQTVAIGTQVSGQVIELNADFNDEVDEGQLIARIDPTMQRQQVRNAEASLERARADYGRTEQDFERNRVLFEEEVITEAEFSQVEYSLAAANANLISAEVNLEQAQQNLAYTEIYAPIDGVVIERNAEVGQTVTSSMSTPQLFLLARDLSELEILASVDESDIGMIEPDQPVRFTVQAYPERRFEGTVRQVRLQSATQENVVNYTVVIRVQNREGGLLPGMTAVVDFIVQQAEDVYKVANAALRFTPTPEMLSELGDVGDQEMPGMGALGPGPGGQGRDPARLPAGAPDQSPDSRPGEGQRPDGAREFNPAAMARAAGAGGPRQGGGRARFATLWFVQDGQLGVMPVETGISDGTQTEISGPDLEAGIQVITGLNTAPPAGGEQPTNNPFQQGGDRGGFRRGGF